MLLIPFISYLKYLPSPPQVVHSLSALVRLPLPWQLAVENSWPPEAQLDGLVITRYGHKLPTQKIKVIEAGHPIPDENGEQASQHILAAVKALKSEDLLLCLFSGGGSSLLSLPVDGISLQDLKEITHQLLCCGANIQEINTVRKHLSAIQGGKLAAPARHPYLH